MSLSIYIYIDIYIEREKVVDCSWYDLYYCSVVSFGCLSFNVEISCLNKKWKIYLQAYTMFA